MIDLKKNPDKMSEAELRNEVKAWRSMKDAGYVTGYQAGWRACGEKIIEEMKNATP